MSQVDLDFRCAELVNLLDEIDVVSFDVFDTALVRQVDRPVGAFYLLASDAGIVDASAFVSERVRAETEARKLAWEKRQAVEVDLQEIYGCLNFRLPENCSVKQLMEHERQLELRIARPRAWVLDFYRHVRYRGLRVGFVSDMYLDAELISEMLERCGYEKPDFLLVSSYEGETKSTGGLYRRLIENLKVAPERVLHLGDNLHSDYDRARELGLRAKYFPKCLDDFRVSRLATRFTQAGVTVQPAGEASQQASWASLWRGLVAARQDLREDDFWFDLGYSHAGPLLLGFALWLHQQAQVDDVSSLFFLARDGHVVHRLHLELLKHAGTGIPGVYLHASRRALNIPALSAVDEQACDFLVSGSSILTAGEFVARAGLDPTTVRDVFESAGLSPDTKIDSDPLYGRLRLLFRSLEEPLLVNARRERELLRDYFEQQGVFEHDHLGLVDIGWHGSMQQSFCKLMHAFDRQHRVNGYYLGTFHAARKHVEAGARHRAYLCEQGKPDDMWRLIRTSVELFEWLFCAPHGSVHGFARRDHGEVAPLFDDMQAEQFRHETADRMQRGALRFAQDFLSAFPCGVLPPVPAPGFAVALIRELLRRPSSIEARLIGDIPHAEGFGAAGQVRLLACPPKGAHLPWNWISAWKEWRKSFWRQGYMRRLMSGR